MVPPAPPSFHTKYMALELSAKWEELASVSVGSPHVTVPLSLAQQRVFSVCREKLQTKSRTKQSHLGGGGLA